MFGAEVMKYRTTLDANRLGKVTDGRALVAIHPEQMRGRCQNPPTRGFFQCVHELSCRLTHGHYPLLWTGQ